MSSREKFEQAIKARFGDSIDYRVCKNSDGEYMAWDMQVAWWAWQAAETDMAVQLANAESKCRELAAENAGQKQSKPSLKAMMSALDAFYADEDVPESAMLIAFNILRGGIETPATDAFLAEVRAHGVEMYAEHLTRKAIASGENKNHAYAYLAANFAAQLRKGADL
ncbi:hypothetical protein I5398_11905 [Citrobacter freundii]|uniref:hypothetical protein n=1 Tax=Citrobacter TaxID=544 RepID=UPI001DD668E0|nr:hypothetical protein [Citrobacter sp. Cpo035]MBJ8796732.1 hypothetical protein [Citrobacter freundii]MDM2915095.1 hypothetical protein [Citrobacter sp. Cpo035]